MSVRGASIVLAAILAVAPATTATAQSSTVDRIAAVVNGEVITDKQLERAVLAARQAGEESVDACTPPERADSGFERRVLECMIDALLQFQHVRRFPQFDAPPEAIDDAFDRLVAQYDSPAAFEEALRQQQRTADEVRYDLEREALISNYINARYRAVVDISEREIQSYYDDVLRPEMERQNAELPLLESVDDELIEPILLEMEVLRRVEEWIADLRRRATIIVYTW